MIQEICIEVISGHLEIGIKDTFQGGIMKGLRDSGNEEYEPRQLDYDTGLPMKKAVRSKYLYEMGENNDKGKV